MEKAAALLLAGVLTAGTLSAFPAAAENAVPSDTASAPTAAETVPEGSTEEASPEPTEPETDTNGDQIPIDKHTPDFYDALTDDTDDAGETESGLTSEEILYRMMMPQHGRILIPALMERISRGHWIHKAVF